MKPSPFPTVARTTRLSVSVDDAFVWHERPGAFERLTPPWEHVQVIERRGGLKDGGRVALRIRAGPVSIRWVAEHRDYVRGRRFVDEQIEGPFSYWVHEHLFEPESPTASRVTDRIEYAPPLGTAGIAAGYWVVRPRLERMLRYRHTILRDDLAAHARAGRARRRIALTGSSGLIGSALAPFLTTGGHQLVRLVRTRPRAGDIGWDPATGRLDPERLEGLDAVVHLAGESVGRRWTRRRKREIRKSRAYGTRLLAEALARLRHRPRVLVSASAVGVYSDRGDEILTEESAQSTAREDFLARVAREWEAATEPARAAGIRTVLLRFGTVLSPAGGALARMLAPFRFGAGGPLGSGDQWMSWVAIDDAVGAIHHALITDGLEGPVNVTSPRPVINREFTRTLGRVLGRPAMIPVPGAALRVAFGEMADAALLGSIRAVPTRLHQTGYPFRHPDLEGALRFVLGREQS